MSSKKQNDPAPESSSSQNRPNEEVVETLEEMAENDFLLNCVVGRKRIYKPAPQAEEKDEAMERVCSNYAFTDFLLRKALRNDEDAFPEVAKDQEQSSTKKKKKSSPPELEVYYRRLLDPKWVSVYNLVMIDEPTTNEERIMMKRAMELDYYNHLEAIKSAFVQCDREWDPDTILEIVDKVMLHKHVESTYSEWAFSIALALLRSTYLKGPRPEDNFVFQKRLFAAGCGCEITTVMEQYFSGPLP